MKKPARPKKTKGTYDPNTARIGFHNWNLDTINEAAPEVFNKAFKEALDLATSEYEVYARFTSVDGVTSVDGGLHLRVELPLGPEEYDDPAWTFSLDELVEYVIQLEESEEYIAKVRDELQRLVDKLEKRITG